MSPAARGPARAWGGLVAFVGAREDALSLALCRVVAAGTLGGHVLRMLLNGSAVFSWTSPAHGGIGQHSDWLFDLVGGNTEASVVVVASVCALASLCACAGLLTRPMLLVAWLTFRALIGTAYDARAAYDNLLVDTLFLLLLSGCGRTLSVDAWLRRRRGRPPLEASRWPRMLLVLQMGLLYGGTAMMKASSGWVPGGSADALWNILHQPMWARFGGGLPAWSFPLTQVATTAVWCFEALGPLFVLSVFLRERASSTSRLKRLLDRVRFRELYLLFGLAMHLGIEATMDIGAFTGASLALYACALRPEEWRALAARLTAGIRRSPG